MIKAENISKSFGKLEVISTFSHHFKSGGVYALLGPSGIGKTTLLNILCGIDQPTAGFVELNPARSIGYIFQDHPLLPWRTLSENVKLPFEVRKKKIDHEYLNFLIEEFGLTGFENSYPEELSGGMKQRASIIQALAHRPDILVLDEPFSSLDFDVKIKIQRVLLRTFVTARPLVLLVTHDIEDAIVLSHDILIFSDRPIKNNVVVSIEFDFDTRDPILVRQDENFSSYFRKIHEALK